MRNVALVLNIAVFTFNLGYYIITGAGSFVGMLAAIIVHIFTMASGKKKDNSKDHGTLDDHLLN